MAFAHLAAACARGCASAPARLVRGAASSRRALVTAARPKQIKRFYQEASSRQEVAASAGPTRWEIVLDGKPMRTPRGTPLLMPSARLARSVAEEWEAQGEKLKPLEMRLTTLSCTAVDLVRPEVEACVDRLLPYLEMDTLCFEDGEGIRGLGEHQQAQWGPVREWFQKAFGVELAVSRSLSAPGHPDATIRIVAENLLERTEWELSAIETATTTAKSLIVAMALVDRQDWSAEDAFQVATLEELFQVERHGLVEGEHDVSHAESRAWFEACRQFASHLDAE